MQEQTYNENSMSLQQSPQIRFDVQIHQELSKFPMKKDDSMFLDAQEFFNDTQLFDMKKHNTSFDSVRETAQDDILQQLDLKKSKESIKSKSILPPPLLSVSRMRSKQKMSNEFNKYDTKSPSVKKELKSSILYKGKKFADYITLMSNIKLFIQKLTQNCHISNNLTLEQYTIIGDVSSTYGQKQQKRKNQKLNVKSIIYKRYLQSIPIFSPFSLFKRLWDSLQVTFILVLFYFISLSLFFQLEMDEQVLYLYKICLLLFIIDTLVTLNTGVILKGQINFSRKDITKNYFKQYFLQDILGTSALFIFVADTSFQTNYYKIIQILIIMKWVKLRDKFIRLSFYLCYEQNQKNMLDLMRLLFLIICVCHVFCSFWHGLALYEINIGMKDTWLHHLELVDSSIMERYAYSFYYLSVTMITVGYGDITPQNPVEIIFTIMTMFVTGIVYAFSLNTIGTIIDNIEKKDKNYKESMQVIHGLMREENVSREVRIKISNYLEYLYKVNFVRLPELIQFILIRQFQIKFFLLNQNKIFKISIQFLKMLILQIPRILKINYNLIQNNNNKQEQDEVLKNQQKTIIEQLSAQLQNDFIIDVRGKYLQDIPFLDSMIEKNQIVLLMDEILYSPGDFIFQEGNIDDCSLYYIVKGSVQLLNEKKDRQEVMISTKEKQQYFGEVSFITGFNRTLSARANDFCRIYKIQRQKFLDKIKTNAHDFETFQMLKEVVIYKNNYTYGKSKCNTCDSENHFTSNCPKTHLIITQSSVKSRFSYSIPQENRIKEGRIYRKKYKGLKISQECDRAVIEINNNEEYFDILDEIELGSNFTERYYANEFNDEFLECIEEEEELDKESSIATPTQKQFFRNRSIRSTCSPARQNRLQPTRKSQDLSLQWNQITNQSSQQDFDKQNLMNQSKETQKQAKSLLSQSYQSSSSSSSVLSSQTQSPTAIESKKTLAYQQEFLNENNSLKQKNNANQFSKLSFERKKTLQDQESMKQSQESNLLENYKLEQPSDNKIYTFKTLPDYTEQNLANFSAFIQSNNLSEAIELANNPIGQNQSHQMKKIDNDIEIRLKTNSISSIGSNQNQKIPQRYIQQEKKFISQLSLSEQQKFKEGLQNISSINQDHSNSSMNSKLQVGFESTLQNKYERSGSLKKSYLSHHRLSLLSQNGRRGSSKFKRSVQNQEQLQQSIGLFINNLKQENSKQQQMHENAVEHKKMTMSVKPSQFSMKNATMQSIGNLHLSVLNDQSRFVDKNTLTKFEEKNLTIKTPDTIEVSQFLIELESAQTFKYYFPSYNYLKVLEKWQKYQTKKNKGKKSYHKKKFNSKLIAFQSLNA